MSEKVIVTNMSALRAKYGRDLTKVKKALAKLIKFDKKYGVNTRIIAVDSKTVMKKFGAKAVSDAADQKANKIAIDAIFTALDPDYMVILGSLDVIPHQNLTNPVPGDPDRVVPSDLPYACEAPYSKKIEDFTGPVRIVGRLPDITAGTDAAYLIGLLKNASTWKSRQLSEYAQYLGITAAVWKDSTKLSLKNLFGSSGAIHLSPPEGYKWPKSQLKARSHFINCHGAESDPHYYGESGFNYPVAHSADWVEKKITTGTLAAVECCYGAELYNPDETGIHKSICNTYLEDGAYGFMGSSTIAYGPAVGNSAADLICQYFLKYIYEGASMGRALLMARQKYVQENPNFDPIDQKTLAQFSLFGDPSIHPVIPPESSAITTEKHIKTLAKDKGRLVVGRTWRRQQLRMKGASIAMATGIARRVKRPKLTGSVKQSLKKLAGEAKLSTDKIVTFRVHPPKLAMASKAFKTKAKKPSSFHLIFNDLSVKKSPGKKLVVLAAKEESGKIVSYRKLYSR